MSPTTHRQESGNEHERRSLAQACAFISRAQLAPSTAEFVIPAALARSLTEGRLGSPAQSVLLAAWAAVVSRLTGESSVRCVEYGPASRRRHSLQTHEARTPQALIELTNRARAADATEFSAVSEQDDDGCWLFDAPQAATEQVACWHYSLLQPTALRATSKSLDQPSLDRLGALLLKMLERFVTNDGQALDGAEFDDVPSQWNPPLRPRNTADTVHALFRCQAARTPNAIAIETASQTLTYAVVERLSSAWATQLQAHGVTRGSVVAVMLPRSSQAIVALLAILKAGAVYLPLDESYPAERLRFMLSDSGAQLLLGDPLLAPTLAADSIRMLDIARLSDQGDFAAVPVADTDAAYIMYTSGSTGTPKGVEIPHAAIVRLVRNPGYVTLDTHTAFLHAAPLGFDASTLEIWGPLLNGGRCVVHDEVLPTGSGLAATIARHQVSSAWLTAALFNAIVDENASNLAGLKDLLIGGEALSIAHVRRAYGQLPAVQISNGYGPTETTTFAATYRIPRDLPQDATSIPIGIPLPDTTLHILNRRLQPVPVGFIGELFIGGIGLARGYHNRPDLTPERFIANPFGPPGTRLYRTGDLARYRHDGNVEFVGRADGQVKLRGYRIEIGEIEAALRSHASVRTGAVLVREDRPGDKRLVAYLVAADVSFALAAVRDHIATLLPEFMLPSAYVMLDSLPLTANGKVDRRALPAPALRRPDLAQEYRAPTTDAEAKACAIFTGVLGISGIGIHDNFFELGGNSLLALQAITRLREAHAVSISTTTFLQQPTAAALAAILTGRTDERPVTRAGHRASAGAGEPIAIIGMAGRFPGANDVEQFWRNLCEGKESIRYFKDAELDASVAATLRNDPNYIKARGVIDDVEMFDAAFFGVSPKEAELMDPQQRKFLEICWECLEHGGYAPDACTMPVGVFAGMYNASYFQKHVLQHRDKIDKVGEFQVMLANEKDYIATRVAHRLNLTGPAISIHTACSTSLVAVCQAFEALRSGQCGMALAGGVSITCPPNSGYLYQEGAMLSPDGHTRSFDADAQGTVFSDGAAVVLLKRLSDAIADGDCIHAVIRGAGVNNDGSQKASFTAPSATAQANVIALAQDIAGVDPRSITYVETHGTATPLGDPIEIEGLTRAFRRSTADIGFCAIGSVKSNLGHLVIAAGATGLIKTALALKEAVLPPSINFSAHNPKIEFAQTPFRVNAQLTPWLSNGPRRAGVSSFGVGGTNAHVVVEEPPLQQAGAELQPPYLLVLSARSEAALDASAARLAEHLKTHDALSPSDVAYTLRVGRKVFQHRAVVVADSLSAASASLAGGAPKYSKRRAYDRPPSVVFMFPGQGAQYPGMGSAVYADDAAFREAHDECAASLLAHAGIDLQREVFQGSADSLASTAITQPATFAIEYSLARMWMARGLEPALLLGHSVGEFVAAVLAGVMGLHDALRLIACRGRLMQAQPAGSMLSIRAAADKVREWLPADLCIAAENSPMATVVSGPTERIDAFRTRLDRDGVANRVLQTSHAFHSWMMDAVVAPFEHEVRAIRLAAPQLPIISTLTGAHLQTADATDPAYWSRHLREPVRFSPALLTALQHQPGVLLEIGPRNTLASLARQHFTPKQTLPEILATLADAPEKERNSVATAVGCLWACGAEIDTRPTAGDAGRRRVPLPGYPFERKRYWVDAQLPDAAPAQLPLQSADAPIRNVPLIDIVTSVPERQSPAEHAMASSASSRREHFISRLRTIVDEVVGVDLDGADPSALFVELGLDSLALTQIALQLQKAFGVKITFRQLMETYSTLGALADHLDEIVPREATPATVVTPAPSAPAATAVTMMPMPISSASPTSLVQQVIEQQMQLMRQQLALLAGTAVSPVAAAVREVAPAPAVAPTPARASEPAATTSQPADEESGTGPVRYDVKKAFGAIARIHTKSSTELTERQKTRLETFMRRYIARTRLSKDYTVKHRPHLADPRVVNGFRPQLKEIIYQIVINRSSGAHVWDLDGNCYVDALNGFGMSLFGWQPPFVTAAVREQLDAGYEIGPQHPLAGEVAQMICELTGFDRAGLCNTGSEAVMGALRIARTITGRSKIALFTGSYHGIFDEVIVRGARKLRAVPAAPGIMPNTAENVLVLDYGTPESLELLRAHAHELAAVLIEPVQSRRPDFQPREFLKELREITRQSGTLYIFDEVVTGFRSHPRGAQAVLGIDADIATYGKVVGGGFPIGVIAGKREYMDALDGGAWQYGDDSIPTVGVTYFAGTFVRHPLALAAAKAVLTHLQQQGSQLQEALNDRTAAMVQELNAFNREVGAPITLKSFSSVWKVFFDEDHPLQDLLFAMMRARGIHILDNFPCFMTTAHTPAEFAAIVGAFKEAVRELQEADFIPKRAVATRTLLDASKPPVPGARLGRDAEGKPAWFMPNPDSPGKFVKVS